MVIKFKSNHFRDIMRICGPITSTCPDNREICHYISLVFYYDVCEAYGSNGYQISKVEVPCILKNVYPRFTLLIPPLKVPPRTREVEIHVDEKEKEYELMYLDEESDVIGADKYKFFEGEPLDYESFYIRAQENFDKYNNGEGKYVISVNPKYLINALEGLKSCDSVIFNFGSAVEPFLIRSGDESVKTSALLYPVRMT